MGEAAGPGVAAEDRRYAWRLLSVTSLGVLLAATNASSIDVALPTVARHFHATPTEASWAVLSYMVVNTAFILVFGRLADIIGRRPLYLAGLGCLTGASLACGFAPNAVVLDILRGVQGVGAAAIITNTSAQIVDAFPADIVSLGLGLNVMVSAVSQMLGPFLGGLLAGGLGWRAVFWFNVPTGVAGLVWAAASLRRSPRHQRRERFDLTGAILSCVALTGLVVALAEGGAVAWASPAVVAGLAVAVVGVPAFVALQRRRATPLVPPSLFADRARSMAYLSAFLLSVSRFAVVLLISLYLQGAAGLAPFQAGVRVLPVAGGLMLFSPLAGRLTDRWGPRLLSTGGALLAGLGLALLAVTISPHVSFLVLAAGMVAVGAGSALFLTPNTTSIMAGIDPNQRGIANGVRSMLQNVGYVLSAALGLAIATSPLGAAAKRAAYAGTLGRLRPAEVAAFTGGYRVAFGLLAALTLFAATASLLRSVGGQAPAGDSRVVLGPGAVAGGDPAAARRAR
jgi:EmrB/QacA subfamily drug resistance transporter